MDGVLESLLLAQPRPHLLVHVIAQMALQFVQHIGRFDATGSHVPSPLRECLVEVKHVVPSVFVSRRLQRHFLLI
jgi:hypothetical protein